MTIEGGSDFAEEDSEANFNRDAASHAAPGGSAPAGDRGPDRGPRGGGGRSGGGGGRRRRGGHNGRGHGGHGGPRH